MKMLVLGNKSYLSLEKQILHYIVIVEPVLVYDKTGKPSEFLLMRRGMPVIANCPRRMSDRHFLRLQAHPDNLASTLRHE